MPIQHNPRTKYDPLGEAKAREIRRQNEVSVEEQNRNMPVVMIKGFGFRIQHRAFRGGEYIEGPLCPREDKNGETCLVELSGESDQTKVVCDVCGFSSDIPVPFQRFREIAHKKCQGHRRFLESGGKIETLDVPYEAIKQAGEDETRNIKIKWSQKDGRNMAVIYFIEKDSKGDKTQIIVDMDREELRYDPSDIPPGKILAKVKAEFPKSAIEISYKRDGNTAEK